MTLELQTPIRLLQWCHTRGVYTWCTSSPGFPVSVRPRPGSEKRNSAEKAKELLTPLSFKNLFLINLRKFSSRGPRWQQDYVASPFPLGKQRPLDAARPGGPAASSRAPAAARVLTARKGLHLPPGVRPQRRRCHSSSLLLLLPPHAPRTGSVPAHHQHRPAGAAAVSA